jgi:SAM-dependent methyltransferase
VDKRTQREKDFHELRFQDGVGARPQEIFYPSINSAKTWLNNKISTSASFGGKGLEFGCSTGDFLNSLLSRYSFDFYGIDISNNAVVAARESISKAHKNIHVDDHLFVMDANNLEFESNFFDFCFGQGVLHHLDFPKCIEEIHRVLKPSGLMIFMEPLGTNPFINFYRLLTPNDRSADEYPFTSKHLKVINQYFDLSDIQYFGFFSLPSFIFAFNPTLYKSYMFIAERMDKLFFKIPGMWRFAWVVVFQGVRKDV